jgi:type I restriction enzyme S subunit
MKDSIKVVRATQDLSEDYIFSTGFVRVTTTDSVNSDFLKQILLSNRFNQSKDSLAIGSTQPAINLSDLSALIVPVPPIDEQRKIASVLYTVDQAIQKTEETINKIKRIGQGLRQTLFTEGYYDHDTELVGTLGKVPVDWETTRLRHIADVSRGKFTHRPRNDPEFYGGKYPFIQTGEVVEATGQLIDYSQTLNQKGKDISKEFEPGTIIITIAGNIGDTAIATFPVSFPDSLVGITPKENVDEYFLEHFLRYRQPFLNRLSTKTTQKNLNLSLLRPIEVVKPPLDEQKKIAAVLSDVDTQIRKESEYKARLQRLKQGLMQDLLSGEVRTHHKDIELVEDVLQHG